MSAWQEITSARERLPIAKTTLEVTVASVKMDSNLDFHPINATVKWTVIFFYYSSLGHSGLKHSRADLNSSFIKRLLNVILSSCPIRIDWLRLPTFGRFFFLLYKLDTKEEEESISEKIEEKAVCIISKYGKLENKFSPLNYWKERNLVLTNPDNCRVLTVNVWLLVLMGDFNWDFWDRKWQF